MNEGRGMTKQEFKRRWESDENGGGLTYDDVADCAIAWGITQTPRIQQMEKVRDRVLAAAGIKFDTEQEQGS